MPYEYFSDEDHLKEWLASDGHPAPWSRSCKNTFSIPRTSASTWRCAGGEKRLLELRRLEFFQDEEELDQLAM